MARIASIRLVWTLGRALGLSLALAAGGSARAEEADAPRGTFSFTIENDFVADSDRDYTNGFRFDYVSPKNGSAAVTRFGRENLAWLTDVQGWYFSFGIGQNLYTPTDISVRNPGPDERPYAAFLYGTASISGDTGTRLDTFALDVGIVGTAALGETVQTEWHRLINVQTPEGWDRQLEDELAFRATYEQKRRFLGRQELGMLALQGDLIPHGNVSLGTIDISAGLGFTARVGQDLADDYGPPRVRPAVSSPGFFEAKNSFSWYLFGGAEARAVGRNLFLEGNTFRDSRSVTIHPYYFDLQAGAAVQVGPAEIAYTHVFRSPEYIGQGAWAEFGSLNLRVKY